MDYRSPIAGLQRQVDELTEQLRALEESEAPESDELAKLRREVVRAEKGADRHRKKEHARDLTARERTYYARTHGGGVLALVLGLFGAIYLAVMMLRGAPFDDAEVYLAVTAAFAVLGGLLFVLLARLDAQRRRSGHVAEDDFSSSD